LVKKGTGKKCVARKKVTCKKRVIGKKGTGKKCVARKRVTGKKRVTKKRSS